MKKERRVSEQRQSHRKDKENPITPEKRSGKERRTKKDRRS